MAEQEIPINQTQFSFEEPIFENETVYREDKPEDLEQKPKSRKKLFIIIGVVGFIFIILLLVLVIAMRGRGSTQEVGEDISPVVTKELGPIQQRIEDSRELLDIADPAKQDLAFPPVDLELRLDPKEK